MPRRSWTKEEDERLLALIRQFGAKRGREGNWHEVSKCLPGRTNKDCRKRWFYSLDPSLQKGRWTQEEDRVLLASHEKLGPAWKEIALLIPGRRDDQCSKRYYEILCPDAKKRLHEWTPEEDQCLRDKVQELGHKWTAIAASLPGRPPLTCRNRWRRLQSVSLPGYPSSVSSPESNDEAEPCPCTDLTSTSYPNAELEGFPLSILENNEVSSQVQLVTSPHFDITIDSYDPLIDDHYQSAVTIDQFDHANGLSMAGSPEHAHEPIGVTCLAPSENSQDVLPGTSATVQQTVNAHAEPPIDLNIRAMEDNAIRLALGNTSTNRSIGRIPPVGNNQAGYMYHHHHHHHHFYHHHIHHYHYPNSSQ